MELVSFEKMLLPSRWVLPLVILIEGFVSIAVEILTIRQLLPVAGGSVIVTSLIIGFFLLFLAIGYQRGGRLHHRPQKVLRSNFFIAAIWLGVGLSYTFITLFFYFVQCITGPHIFYPLIAYLLVIIAPLIYLLGQTVPIVMNMVRQHRAVGEIGGNALGLSTLGSFLGAILTTLIFMYFVGVAWTVLVNFLLLLLLVIILSESRASLWFQLCMGVAVVSLVSMLNLKMERSFFILTNNYANYQIVDHQNSMLGKDEKIFLINETASSFVNKRRKGFPYIESIKKILFTDLKLRNAQILILGAGGFSLTAESTYQNYITYVDIDKQIKNLIVPRFLNTVGSNFIVDDARHYLQTTANHYTAIVVDTYSDIKSMPSYLLTYEYMQVLRSRLLPNGVVIFNIIANPLLSDSYSKRVDNTIRAVFSSCMVVPNVYADRATNIIYTCSAKNNQADRVVYSDNLNTATTDSFNW